MPEESKTRIRRGKGKRTVIGLQEQEVISRERNFGSSLFSLQTEEKGGNKDDELHDKQRIYSESGRAHGSSEFCHNTNELH